MPGQRAGRLRHGDGAVGLFDLRLLLAVAAFVPAMLLGVRLGRHIDLRISREQLFRLLNFLLVLSGLSLVARYGI